MLMKTATSESSCVDITERDTETGDPSGEKRRGGGT